jgi:hypothetical protein
MKGSKSKLAGARCGLCPRPLLAGQTILYKHMANDSYDEDRLVYHRDCMAALIERAPRGVPATDHKAVATDIRQRILESGDLYGRVGA